MNKKAQLTFIVGPTASGKSQMALDMAVRARGAVVNADSIQVYRQLDIGSAKPTGEERALVPHFLYDLVDPDQEFTAGDYRRAALQVIEAQAQKLPLIFVGGSGFYIQALEKGMYEAAPATPEIQEQLNAWAGAERLYAELQARDPATAQRLAVGDQYRIRRALEVTLATGRPFSEVEADFQKQTPALHAEYEVQKIGIQVPRDVLRHRVVARTRKMLELGLLAETERLVAKGYANTKALQSVGYKECVAYLAGRQTPAQLEDSIVTSTMQLAKKQMTWFKRDPSIRWIEPANS